MPTAGGPPPAAAPGVGGLTHRGSVRGRRGRGGARRCRGHRLLDPRFVLFGFAALMVAAGLRMLREQLTVGGDCALPDGGVNWRGCLPKAIGSGVVVRFLTGLFGVGGGFLIIPALVLLLGLPMTVAVGTSLASAKVAARLPAAAGSPTSSSSSPRSSWSRR